jgi:hypothetical protein
VIYLEKSTEKLEQQANASVGYGPNNPEPVSFKESEIPKDKDALHSAAEYIEGKKSNKKTQNTVPTVYPSVELVNRTEP